MANLISPSNVQVVTKNGELLVNFKIDLNINLNGTTVNIPLEATGKIDKAMKKEDDDVEWAIPDFKPTEKINFGK